jgi:hypothetical protein
LPLWKKKGVEEFRLWLALNENRSHDEYLSTSAERIHGEEETEPQ